MPFLSAGQERLLQHEPICWNLCHKGPHSHSSPLSPLRTGHIPQTDGESREASSAMTLDSRAVDEVFAQAETLGRTRREAQLELAHLTADVFHSGGYAVIEAGTGTGKSLGYSIPAALQAHASGRPVALSTFTRVLQTQLVERELPFVQHLVPGLTYALLQGRANYLSLSRLVEEIEDALTNTHLPLARAWPLAMLVRFAEMSTNGTLEELGYLSEAGI